MGRFPLTRDEVRQRGSGVCAGRSRLWLLPSGHGNPGGPRRSTSSRPDRGRSGAIGRRGPATGRSFARRLGRTRTPRPGTPLSQTVYSRSRGRRRAMAASVSRTRLLPGTGQPSSKAPTVSQRPPDRHRISGMGVFEGRLGAGVTEQTPDREHGLSLPERDAGVGVAEVVQAHIVQTRFGPELPPRAIQPVAVPWAVFPARRKNPMAAALQPAENFSGRFGQPDGAGPRLAVAEEQVPLAVVRPPQVSGSHPCGTPSAEAGGWRPPRAAGDLHDATRLSRDDPSPRPSGTARAPFRR